MGKKLIILGLTLLMVLGCTENQKARSYGGTSTIKLEKGQKLIMATWKGEDLWYLTEPMDSGYTPKTKTLRESSSYGIIEGKMIFEESR